VRADCNDADKAINPSGSSAVLRINSIFMPVDSRAIVAPIDVIGSRK
jgi:hypothetical protein